MNLIKMIVILLILFKILKENFSVQRLLLCPECHQPTVNFANYQEARMGFPNKLTISFDICDWERIFYTSNQCTRLNKKQGRNMFEFEQLLSFEKLEDGWKQ